MTLGNPTEKIIPARRGTGSPVDSPGSVRQTRWHWGLGLPPPGRWMDPGDSEGLGSRELVAFPYI